MNYIVTEFEAVDEDYLIPKLQNKSTMGGNEDVMELLWHNGQVVLQSQSQNQKSKESETSAATKNEIKFAVVEDDQSGPSNFLMQEDEMASWLHYPVDDNNNNTLLESYLNSNGILYPTPVSSTPVVAAAVATSLPPPPPPSVKIPSSQPPVPPYNRLEGESGQPKLTNFVHFSRDSRGRGLEPGQGSSSKVAPMLTPLTNVATSAVETPESRGSRVSEKPTQLNVRRGEGASGIAAPGSSLNERETETCEISATSSHDTGGLAESAGIEQSTQKSLVPTDDQKRKSRDTGDIGWHNEDVEFVYPDEKKQSHGGSTSMKRSRAAEVHNLSERKRRDRINEKMKALEDLIPRCNKSDKASMLDEAIEYLKSLQMQVQMMSMGCGMVPMMFPGVQQYVPQMAMGMGMGMNRTMVPYPAILPGSSVPNPAAMAAGAVHLAQHFPIPEFNMSPATVAGPAASQTANYSAPMMTSFPLSTQNQPPVPNFADPFQQYLDLQQTQLQVPLSQGLGGMPPIATKPSSSNKDATNPDIHQTG